jgi:hypothetical protein
MKTFTLQESIEKIEKILQKTMIPKQDQDSIDEELHRITFLDNALTFVKFGLLIEVKEVSSIIETFDKSDLPF